MTTRNKRGTSPARDLLCEYADLLRENDTQIRRLEALMELQEPTINQQAQATELDGELKANIALEKEKGAVIETLVGKLSRSNHRAVIRMRYMDLLEWPEVLHVLFGEFPDYAKSRLQYQRKGFRYHSDALKELDRLLANDTEA